MAEATGAAALQEFLLRLPGTSLIHLLWLVPVLAGQAMDARWSRGTVLIGVLAASAAFLSPGSGFGYVGYTGVSHIVLLFMLSEVLGVLWSVWAARSAHELGSPPARPSPDALVRAASPGRRDGGTAQM